MKQKILLISKSSSTSVSIRSYLRSIFGKYLEVDAFLAGEAGKEQVEAADLVVFASRSAEKATREFLCRSFA